MAGISIGFALARLVSAGMLLWALSEPTEFYLILLRSVVCGVALYSIYRSVALEKFGWAWLFGGIAILFNPLVPFNFPAGISIPLRIIVALLFLESIYSVRKKIVIKVEEGRGLERSLLRFVVMLVAVAAVMVAARLWLAGEQQETVVGSKMGMVQIQSPAVAPAKPPLKTSSQVIPWQKAEWYYDQYATVEGTVVSARSSVGSCTLYFHQNHDKYFRVMIPASELSRFPSTPGRLYQGKTVRVSGHIVEDKGRPEIILTDPAQIEIVK